ncbi:MAG: AEC family transporter [Patescibacteria group bacterium]|nr:AEC family transporter [Patescibacteria group bacterium]
MPQVDISLVSGRVLIIFLTMFAGVFARRLKLIDEKSTKHLSSLLVYITQPMLIIDSFQMDYDASKLLDGAAISVASVGVHLLLAFLSFFVYRFVRDKEERKIYEFGTIFTNCAFVGYPVLSAVLGEELGVFYGSFYTIFFNLFIWTYGIILLNRGKGGTKLNYFKVFVNAGTVSVTLGILLYVSKIKLPYVVHSAVSMVGDMTFPLSMIIVGSLVAHVDFKALLFNFRTYLFLFIKLLVIPCIVMFLCIALGLDKKLVYICTLMASMPSASNTAIFTELFGGDAKLGARLVGVSTLVSVLTIPAIIYLLTTFA